MFFDLKTLTKSGKFFNIWKAANCGVKRLTRKEVLSIDICIICDEVVKLVCSRSTRPEERLSLFLSAKLTSGILRVYGRQVQLLFNDLNTYYVAYNAYTSSAVNLDEEESDTPLAVIKNVKRIRAKKPAGEKNKENQPEDALASLERSLALFDKDAERLSASMEVHRRPEEITMREVSMPLREIPAESNIECGELEKYITDLVTLPAVPLREKSKKRRATDDVEDVMKEVSQQKIQIPVPETTREFQDLSRIESFTVEHQMAQNNQQKQVQVISQEQEPQQEIQVEPQVIVLRVQKDRQKRKQAIYLIVEKHRKNVAIDMNPNDRMLLFQESDYFLNEPEEKLLACNTFFDTFNVLEHFLVNDDAREMHLQDGTPQLSWKSLSKVSRNSNFASSTPIRMPVGSLKPARQSLVQGLSHCLPSIHEAKEKHTEVLEIPKTRELHSDVIIPEVPAEIRLRRESSQLENNESTHLVMEAITNLKAFGKERIVLEDIAERPFTKRTISSAFNSLLILTKQRYVTLYTWENSIALSHIEIGPKVYELLI